MLILSAADVRRAAPMAAAIDAVSAAFAQLSGGAASVPLRVPIAQAEMLVKALKGKGTPVWYVRFEDAGHLELTPATNDLSIYTWIMFVQKYLLN